MKQTEGKFKSIRDLNIFYKGWLPEQDVKAVLFLVHGFGDYCERFMNVVDYFVPLGYAIYGLDHVGHGRSDGERGMVVRFEDFIEPLVTYRRMVGGWHPETPVFIYGQSLGGLITSFHLLEHQADFKGAILSAPLMIMSDPVPPLVVAIGNVLSIIAPRIGVSRLDTSNISKDKTVVDAYESDPLGYHGKVSARVGAETFRAISRVSDEAEKISLPVIILQGSEDKLVDPAGASVLYGKVSSKDKTLKIYEGLYHEIRSEPEREIMFRDLEDWLQAHV